jgi:hypothetical protein
MRCFPYLAAAAMLALMAAGVKELVTKPYVITNREVVVMPNDSLIQMQREIAVLRGANATLGTIAETRAILLRNLTGPMQRLTDSQLLLSRTVVSKADKIETDLTAYHKVQEGRHSAVMNELEQIEARPLPVSIVEVPYEVRDTVYATASKRERSWWDRLKSRFLKPKN